MKNKKRLIVAQDACKYAKDQLFKGKFNFEEYDAVIETINNTDTIDAVEVVHGRWIYHECVSSHDGAISGYSCSECGAFVNEEIFDMDEFHKDFCGHCGAKMDEIGDKQNGKSKFE